MLCAAFVSLLLPLTVQASPRAWRGLSPRDSTVTIPAAIAEGPSTAESVYPGYGLDGPKVHPINGTVFDWWYFHAYSTHGDLSHVAVFFYSASNGAYQVLQNKTSVLDFGMFGSYANGTPFWIDAYPEQAEVTTDGDFTSGKWGDYGSWDSYADGSVWKLKFDVPEYGVKGTVDMSSIAPPGLPCGPVEAGETEIMMPGFGIAYTVPDANAVVQVQLNDSVVEFTGNGYHDRSWGTAPFTELVGNWYWGTGRLGPYSLVFYDTRDNQGNEYFTTYLSRNNEYVYGSCAANSVVARPWGGDDTYPPSAMQQGDPAGLSITVDVDGKEFRINATNYGITNKNYAYTRWLGDLTGELDGEVYTGRALYEVVKV